MTIPGLLRRVLDASGTTIPKLLASWPFSSSMKTLYNRLSDTSLTSMRSCDGEILQYAFQSGFGAEVIEFLRGNRPPSTILRAVLLYPDLSFGEITAIEDIRRVSPELVLTNDAIRSIVERRRKEVASSTFPGS